MSSQTDHSLLEVLAAGPRGHSGQDRILRPSASVYQPVIVIFTWTVY